MTTPNEAADDLREILDHPNRLLLDAALRTERLRVVEQDAVKAVLKANQTVRALTMRLGTFNEAWWDRFAAEVVAGLTGEEPSE